MFQYKKYSIAALALLLSSGVFAAGFEDAELQTSHLSATPKTNQTTEENTQAFLSDAYRIFFSIGLKQDDRSLSPNRPENVSEGAFYARGFLGSNKWVLLNNRYTVSTWMFDGTPCSMIDNTLPESENAHAILKWEHISKIWSEDGSLCHALPIWRAYCDTDISQATSKNFIRFLGIYDSKFGAVPVDTERLENVLKSYSPFTPNDAIKTPRCVTMEDFINAIMGNLINN